MNIRNPANDVLCQIIHADDFLRRKRHIGFHACNAALIDNRTDERQEFAGTDALVKQIHQPADARRNALGAQQIDGVGGHAHKIAQCAVGIDAGILFPCAGQDAARDALIELVPVPHRHGQVADHAVLLMIQAEFPGFHARRADVAIGDDIHANRLQLLFGAGIQNGRPFQVDGGPRIGHLSAESESVNRSRHAVDRIVGDVADEIVVAHGAGDRTENKFRFIDAKIVGSDVVIAGQQRTVENLGFRMGDGLLDAGVQQHGRCGEDDVVSLARQLIDDGRGVLRGYVFTRSGFNS